MAEKLTYAQFLKRRGPKGRKPSPQNKRAWLRATGKTATPRVGGGRGGPVPAPTGGPTPKVLPGPYDRYRGISGAEGVLRGMDRSSERHQAWAKDVMTAFSQLSTGLVQANQSAQDTFKAQADAYAGGAAAAPQLPNVTVGGTPVQPGSGGTAMQAQAIMGQGVADAVRQDASFQSLFSKLGASNLGTSILGALAEQATKIPGQYNAAKQQYMQKLDEAIFAADQQAAKLAAEAEQNKLKMANQRYTAQLRYLGQVLGIEGQNSRAQLQADTQTGVANLRAETAAADRAQRTQDSEADRQLRRELNMNDNRTRRQIQASKQRAESLKKSRADVTKIAKELDRLWLGEPGDPSRGTTEGGGAPFGRWGWRYTSQHRGADANGVSGRRKAAAQVVRWLFQFDQLNDQQIKNLFMSKGFSQSEWLRAVQDYRNPV